MPLPGFGAAAAYLLDDGSMLSWSIAEEGWVTRRGKEFLRGAVPMDARPRFQGWCISCAGSLAATNPYSMVA